MTIHTNHRPLRVAVFVGVLIGLAVSWGCKKPEQTPRQKLGPLKELAVLTPHNETICKAFSAGFSSWYVENRGARVHISWIQRGTPQCLEYVRAIPEMRNQVADYENPDVLFGGGVAIHDVLAEEGFCRTAELGELIKRIPAEVHGVSTRHPENRWFTTGLSSFGILYNEQACAQRGIAAPTTWEDLADPRFSGWIGLANPAASGSNLQCMNLILQHQDWDAGWGLILRTLANARALDTNSSDVLTQVKSGVFLAAFAVNFDGMALAANSSGLKYIDPPQATAVTPDIISILSTTQDMDLAEDFLRFTLSEEGQALWGVAREHRKQHGDTLYHYPIDPAVYEKYADKLAVTKNPLTTSFGLQVDSEMAMRHGAILKWMVPAACGGNHIQLQKAWQAVIAAGMPAAALAELTAPVIDAQTALDLGQKLMQVPPAEAELLTKDWSAKFAEKYAKVLELVKG